MVLYARDGRLNWRPRFAPQSYLAYHPWLDAATAETFRRADAPPFVIYHHQAIDHYQPFAVDPLTLTELLRWYEPARRLDVSHSLLQRRTTPAFGEWQLLGRGVVRAGQSLALPTVEANDILFLKLQYAMTDLGRLTAFAYRVDPPIVRFEYRNGPTIDAQVPWRNVGSGFPVSPFPLDLNAAQAVFAGGHPAPVARVLPHPHPAFVSDIPFELFKVTRR
jgi:hypothetical protein